MLKRTFLAGVASVALLWAGDARAAFSSFKAAATPASVVATPTLIQHVGSTVNDNNGITGNAFVFTLPNTAGAGNCLVLGLVYPYSAGRTISVSDSTGNTWTAAGSQVTDSTNMAMQPYVCKNASAAVHTITVTFDTALKPFGYEISEFNNIDTSSPVDGTHGTASVASPNVSAGSYTPTTNNDAQGGHLIWTFARSNDKVGTTVVTQASAIAPTGSQLLLSADNTCTIPGAASYFVQTANAAINPGFTVTQSSGTNFVCSSIALKVASAGTAAPAGIRIKRILHQTWTQGGSSAVFCFPCDGNLLFVSTANASDSAPFSSVVDSNSQTYTNPGAAGNPQGFYFQNATPSNALKVTVTGTLTVQFSLRLYDIVGAQASSFLNSQGANGAAPGSGTVCDDFPDHTPTGAPGLTITTLGFGTGPGLGMASGAPPGSIFDLVTYAGETDQDRMDNADCVGHVYYSTTVPQTWNWIIGAATNGSTTAATAVSFK